MWQEIDSREPRTLQRAGRGIGSNERSAGASPQTTRNAGQTRRALDALNDIERRDEVTFQATTVVRFDAPERSDGQDLAAFVAADVDDPPSPAADADDIG